MPLRRDVIDVRALEDELARTRQNLMNSEHHRINAERALSDIHHNLRRAQDENRILKVNHAEELKDMRARHEKLSKERDSIHEERMAGLNKHHQRALIEEQGQYEKALKELRTDQERKQEKYEGEMKAKEMKYLGTVDELKNKHRLVIDREKTTHGQEVNKLVGQLLVNQNDNSGWPDDKLKYKFQQIQSLVKGLVSPRHKETRVPAGTHLTSDLDPSKFLERTKTSNAHFLLQSIIWAILCEQFFSAPYGFGLLGPGNSQRTLLELLNSLTGLLGGPSNSSTNLTGQAYEIFQQSAAANNWRSATFQCMYESVIRPSSDVPALENSIGVMAQRNLSKTASRISSVLVTVSKASKIALRDGVDREVLEIARHVQALAFQFGLHPARLQLALPKQGEVVKIGEEIHDCEDGDAGRGTKVVVDLITLPGLQIVMDGRSEKDSKRTIVPCEIYPYVS